MRISLIAAVAVGLVAAAPTAADNTQLVGNVGPGFSINLKDSNGADVKHLDPGTYTLLVHDQSADHNFDLSGPGVHVATDVDFVGDKTFTVTIADGTYNYICAAHPGQMHGSFTAGTATTPPPTTTSSSPPPPAPKKATLSVGAGGRIIAPVHLAAGRYALTVRDASAKDDLHLKGAGLDRKTGVAFKGTAHWTVTLKKGSYKAWSDTHKSLGRTIKVG